MSALDVGRVCLKKVGREVGKKCVIVDILDKSFVLVTGPETLSGVKRRRVNTRHLEPLKDRLQISPGDDDEKVTAAIEAAGKTEEMRAEAKP